MSHDAPKDESAEPADPPRTGSDDAAADRADETPPTAGDAERGTDKPGTVGDGARESDQADAKPAEEPPAPKPTRMQRRREKIREEIERNRRGEYTVPTWVLVVALAAILIGWFLLVALA